MHRSFLFWGEGRRGTDDSPETIAAYDKAFSALERDEGPVNFKDDKDREKARLDGLRVVAAYLDSPPADAHRKRRVVELLETAVEGIASNRHHPQPGMHCSWCQFRNECMAWLPGMTTADVQRAA